MAVESFFVIETSFNRLKELLGDEIVRVDKEYDEITISYNGFFSWMYFYKEGEADVDEEE
jgi:oligopeptidase B